MARTRRRWRNIILEGNDRFTKNVQEERRKKRGKGKEEKEEEEVVVL
jgi:hypothetical protein